MQIRELSNALAVAGVQDVNVRSVVGNDQLLAFRYKEQLVDFSVSLSELPELFATRHIPEFHTIAILVSSAGHHFSVRADSYRLHLPLLGVYCPQKTLLFFLPPNKHTQ